jgi:hypothetical protein
VINLDDEDEYAKIDDKFHNKLSLLFSNSMDLDEGNHNDPLDKSDSPCV